MSTLQPDLVWADVLRSLSKSMSPSTFSTFVKPLSISSIEEVGEDRAIIRFQAASPYVAQQAEMRCYAQLKQAVDESTQKNAISPLSVQPKMRYQHLQNQNNQSRPQQNHRFTNRRPNHNRAKPTAHSLTLSTMLHSKA
ncbi:hypothetical protein LRY65_03740 [Candidatus Woesebacteria bacterium]|nr:hypothetical protein [Candidatus Woesebacteria bacterium]